MITSFQIIILFFSISKYLTIRYIIIVVSKAFTSIFITRIRISCYQSYSCTM